jgi:hypothetical protein
MAEWALPIDDPEQIARVARRVAADSAGIPLLAVALLEAVAGGLDLGGGREGWLQPGRTLAQTLPADLPESVIGAVRVMFGRTSGDARKVLTAAAAVGGRATTQALGAASELSGNRLAAALAELELKQWLTADARGYAFVARVFGDVISRDMVTEGERLRIRALSRA